MSSPPATPSFLDDLSDAARLNVFRHFSSKPSLSYRSLYVNAEDALAALHPWSCFCKAARTCCTRVWATESYPLNRSPDASLAGTASLKSESSVGYLFEIWLQLAGRWLTDLTVDCTLEESLMGESPESFVAMLSDLQTSCPALRHLHIRWQIHDDKTHLSVRFVDDLLRITDGRLHELHASDSYSVSIAQQYAGLRSLNLWHRDLHGILRATVPTLKNFEIRRDDNNSSLDMDCEGLVRCGWCAMWDDRCRIVRWDDGDVGW